MDTAPSVSVLIPVLNGARTLASCIDGILSQTVQVREIIVVDSGSTDGSLEVMARYPAVRVIRIDAADFNHGETRNLGVRAATSDWVALTVQDARPVDNLWLEKLFDGVTDDQVVAVCGSQVVPHDRDKNPVEWFRPLSEPRLTRVQFSSVGEFDRLSPEEKMRACSWDDVTAIYRRRVLLDIPFRRATYAEDALWANDAIRAGHALVYNPAARVYHYHAATANFMFRRTLAAMYVRYRCFGYLHDEPDVTLPLVRAVRSLVREPGLTWSERFYWTRYIRRNQLAVRAASRVFREAVAADGSALEELYERYCDRPPTPEKTSSLSLGSRGAIFSD
jgi:rhamnosyltransferase